MTDTTSRGARYTMVRYSLRPVQTWTGVSNVELARRLGTSSRQVQRWAALGLTPEAADLVACRLNLHPSQLWPGWWWEDVASTRGGGA